MSGSKTDDNIQQDETSKNMEKYYWLTIVLFCVCALPRASSYDIYLLLLDVTLLTKKSINKKDSCTAYSFRKGLLQSAMTLPMAPAPAFL